jgi:hypothetical protein
MKMILATLSLLGTSCATSSVQRKQFEFNPSSIHCNVGEPTRVGIDVHTNEDVQVIVISWLCKEESSDRINYMLGQYNLE